MSGEEIEQPEEFNPRPTVVAVIPQGFFDTKDPMGVLELRFAAPVPVPYVRDLIIGLQDAASTVEIRCRVAGVATFDRGTRFHVELRPFKYNQFRTDSVWVTFAIRSAYIPGHEWAHDIEWVRVYPEPNAKPFVLYNGDIILLHGGRKPTVIVEPERSTPPAALSNEAADLTFNVLDEQPPTLADYLREVEAERKRKELEAQRERTA